MVHESTSCWWVCLEVFAQHISFENIFLLCFNNIVCPFGLMAETPQNKKCQRFLIKVSNIGTYKTYSHTKANTINFYNIYVVLCLRNIHFNYTVYGFNEKQNMKACFNLVLCIMLVTFLTDVKPFLTIDESWTHHFCFCVSEHQLWFHRQFSDLFNSRSSFFSIVHVTVGCGIKTITGVTSLYNL